MPIHACDRQVYVLSDFSAKTLEYYESATHLRPFVERGLLDFAVFDAANDSELKLQHRCAFQKGLRGGPTDSAVPRARPAGAQWRGRDRRWAEQRAPDGTQHRQQRGGASCNTQAHNHART